MLSKEKGNKSGILIALSLILFLVAIIMAIISTSKTVAPKEDKITYTEKSNIDYKVLVKQNGYNKKYLLEEEEYDASLIDDIVATFDYSILSDEKLDFEYTYNIEAIITSTDNKNSKKIINDKYTLKAETKKEEKNTNAFKISEELNIDYDKYNQNIKEVLSQYENEDITSTLQIVLNVNVKSNFNDQELNTSPKTILSIPLSLDTIKINKEEINNTEELASKSKNFIKNKKLMNYSILMSCLAGIILIIAFVSFLLNPNSNNSYKKEYRKVRKMVRDYDEIIKRTYKMPSIKDKKIVNLSRIDDFMLIQDKYDLPMVMVEKEKTITFVMINNKKAWTYTINKLKEKNAKNM